MPVRPDLQLEKSIDDALRKNDFKPLRTLLLIEICEDVKIKCSKQFFHKLDELICRELNKNDTQTVSTILVSIGRCCKNISILGQAGLPTMIKQGLIRKEIILNQGNSKDEAVINMVEDFFDVLMVVHDVNDEGKRQVLESFAPRICSLVVDSRVNICIQQETLKKMNAMLDRMPQDARKILSNQEMLILMSSMGERILDVGDYDLQVGIVEALCRMTTEKQRQELACQWFSMDFIASAFKGIKDSEFETDCRVFLNFVNGMLGDKRRVFTFPCLSAFLDKHELQIPSDEKLEEFWIDFNLGSQTLSFYIAGDDDDHQWEAVTVPEETVQLYNIEVRESKKLLIIILKNTIKISRRKGKELLLYFDASLEISNVTEKIFGVNKCREFTRKQGVSVAKTSIHILFDKKGSQTLVPESQSSPGEEVVNLEEKRNPQERFAEPPKYIKHSNEGDRKNSQLQIITPSKRKMSEASLVVPGSDRYTVRSPPLLVSTPTPQRGRIKPPLQMMSSAKQPGISKTSENDMCDSVSLKSKPSEGRNRGSHTDKAKKTAQGVETTEEKVHELPNQNCNEFQDTVADSQAVVKIDKPVSPGVFDSICKNKTDAKWTCWMPVANIQLCKSQPRANTSSEDTRNQDVVSHKKLTKRKSASSISDDNPEETRKIKSTKETVVGNRVDTVEVEICERSNQHPLNHLRCWEERNIEHTKQRDWFIQSETTFKSVLLSTTVEESLIYRKKFILSKDLNTTVYSKNSSRKSMKSHRKSGKRLPFESNSCDLKPKKMREKTAERGLADAAESLISQINKRYKAKNDVKCTRTSKESLINSGFSNRSDLQLRKEKVQKKSFRQLKTTFVSVTSECPLNDVYNFNLNGADEPVIKLGVQEFQATCRETCVDNSIKWVAVKNHGELEPSLKRKDKRGTKNHKKHLFSDTETDYKCDDSMTDVSWLREPASKPQLLDYSRNRSVKRQLGGKPGSSLERGQPRHKVTPNKNVTKQVDEAVPGGRTRLPRRAAKRKKNYKDSSTSESESEPEFSNPVKEKLPVKEENAKPSTVESIHSRSQIMKLPKKEQDTSPAETPEKPPQGMVTDDSTDFSPVSSSGTPSSIEVMRGVAKITERDFTQDYNCVTTKSVSLSPKNTSLESLSSKNGVGGSVNSPQSSDKNLPDTRGSHSPSSHLLFLPSQTPATKDNTAGEIKRTGSVVLIQEAQKDSCSGETSCNSEKQFIENEIPDISEKHVQREREDSHSPSLPVSTDRQETIQCRTSYSTVHSSGPAQRSNHVQMYVDNQPNNSDDTELKEERTDLHSKNLSEMRDTDHHSTMSENKSEISACKLHVSEGKWRVEVSGSRMMAEKLRNVERRMQTVDQRINDFVEKSSKSVLQHIETVNHQIQEHRIEKLHKFQFDIIQELENFEKESQSLINLEEEFVNFGEKMLQQFSAYQNREKQRVHLLRASFEENIHNTDKEENIFASQMFLMKEDMKRLEERLLEELHEEQLARVRQGLLSLLTSGDSSAGK